LFQSLKTKYNTSEPNNPNIELTNLTDTITWKWPYNGDDNADTILGDLITGSAVVVKATGDGNTYTAIEATDYSTEVSFGVKLTVSQVD
jgi:hypothetical protein